MVVTDSFIKYLHVVFSVAAATATVSISAEDDNGRLTCSFNLQLITLKT